MTFWTGFLLGIATGMVALVLYACCRIAGRADEDPPVR